MAALHSIVERKVWRDEKVRKLSHGPANAREMWMYLLTCDSQGAFPGLFVLRVSTAADDLEWPLQDTKDVLQEVVDSGMAEYDAATGVVRLPNALAKRTEQALSEKTTKGWRNAFDNIPRCDLARSAFYNAIETIRRAHAEAIEAGHKAKDPSAPLRAFVSKPPAWINNGDSPAKAIEAPSKPLPRAIEAPSEVLPSPIDAEIAVAVEGAVGEAGVHARACETPPASPARPAPSSTPSPTSPGRLSDGAASIRSVLAKARDLWPTTFVSDDDLACAATRIAEDIDEPTNRAIGEHYVIATEAVRHARTHAKRFTAVTPEGLLARFEEKCGWMLGEYRSGKRHRAGQANSAGVVVDDDFAAHEARQMEDLQRGTFRSRGGDPASLRTLLPTGTGGRR